MTLIYLDQILLNIITRQLAVNLRIFAVGW